MLKRSIKHQSRNAWLPVTAFLGIFTAFTVTLTMALAADPDKAASATKSKVSEADLAKLPPPSDKKVDFVRDIKPILQKSCMDCHDADGPMGKFRLDKREFALKGGEKGIDIIPGKSAKSSLIHYVASLVKDMEMPPKDQGEPLTKEQISLLRAWIDQGAHWGPADKEKEAK
jgi:hypothetical protein